MKKIKEINTSSILKLESLRKLEVFGGLFKLK